MVDHGVLLFPPLTHFYPTIRHHPRSPEVVSGISVPRPADDTGRMRDPTRYRCYPHWVRCPRTGSPIRSAYHPTRADVPAFIGRSPTDCVGWRMKVGFGPRKRRSGLRKGRALFSTRRLLRRRRRHPFPEIANESVGEMQLVVAPPRLTPGRPGTHPLSTGRSPLRDAGFDPP